MTVSCFIKADCGESCPCSRTLSPPAGTEQDLHYHAHDTGTQGHKDTVTHRHRETMTQSHIDTGIQGHRHRDTMTHVLPVSPCLIDSLNSNFLYFANCLLGICMLYVGKLNVVVCVRGALPCGASLNMDSSRRLFCLVSSCRSTNGC